MVTVNIPGQIDIFEMFKMMDESKNKEKMNEISLEDVQKVFRELITYSKNLNNPISIRRSSLSENIKKFLPRFKKEGWVKVHSQNPDILFIEPSLLDYRSIDEQLQEYEEGFRKLLQKEDFCWYKDGLSYRNFFHYSFKTEEERDVFYKRKREVTIQIALELGLKHWKEVPTSRGQKSGGYSKWSKKYLLPAIVEKVLTIKDINELENFFNESTFYFGREDEDTTGCTIPIPPYPCFKKLMLTEFSLACLAQAKQEKEVYEILDYAGYSMGGIDLGDSSNKKYVYPKGMSFDTYLESLTANDLKLMADDKERLKRLHGKDIIGSKFIKIIHLLNMKGKKEVLNEYRGMIENESAC